MDSRVPTASMVEWAPRPPVRSLIRAAPSSPRSVDDVGGAVVEGQLLAGLVAAHDDDALGAELARGEDAVEADGAVADHDDGLARADLGGHGTEPAGAQDVGGGEEARDQVGVGDLRGGDEGAVGKRDAGVLGLGADRPDGLAVDAGALVAGSADLAGVVRREERADDELAAAGSTSRRRRRPRRCRSTRGPSAPGGRRTRRGRATGPTRRCRWPTGG